MMKLLTQKMKLLLLVSAALFWPGAVQVYAQHYIWANGIGGTSEDIGNAIARDASGNIYIAGQFSGSVDFDPGTGTATLVSNGAADIFVAKYDAGGNYIWAINIGGTSGDMANAIAVDGAGNAYITGQFSGMVDFDPGTGTANLAAGGVLWGAFVAKYDANGDYVWAMNLGAGLFDIGYGITVDASTNVYVTGYFSGTADFDPGPGTAELIGGSTADIFIAKYNTDGEYVWAKGIGNTSSDAGYGISVDAGGNVYVTGQFTGTVDFDPGTNIADLTSASTGATDIFIAKYDVNGDYVWAKGIGANGADIGYAIAVEGNGNAYVTGYFTRTVDFDPGAGIANLVCSDSASDIFIAKYDAAGNYLWAKSMGGAGAGSDVGYALALDADASVYFTGYFTRTADFDGAAGVANLISNGGIGDIFISKYDAAGNYVWAESIGDAGDDIGRGVVVDNGVLYVTGQFTDAPDFDFGAGTATIASNGAKDVFVLKMQKDYCMVATDLTQSACDSFSFNNVTYTASGVYKDTFTSITSCDSIVTLTLTVNTATVNPVVTGRYCDSVTINGITYTSTGIYVQYYQNSLGCDSNITYDIVINSVQASVTRNGTTLTAGNAGSYQWINCDSNTRIQGATSRSYTAVKNGNYAVIAASDGCTDTSDCVLVDGITGMDDVNVNSNVIKLYPNPASSEVIIDAGRDIQHATIRISNLLGQTLMSRTEQRGTHIVLDMTPYTNGLYVIEITEGNKTDKVRIIKQ